MNCLLLRDSRNSHRAVVLSSFSTNSAFEACIEKEYKQREWWSLLKDHVSTLSLPIAVAGDSTNDLHIVFGLFWKAARIGERMSPYVSLCCILMAITLIVN
ncbi:hypothetical protein SmJEL517_g05501 [Synchytrium microbalum]|uniref:Uncharacterized protein n=1 Tax=Synchytrium microbalum TaxID=1806994 RepID=A0A507BUZ6_9FUNG|nr:uncharacterized protein SmJEL517_g05501 [Synchytrium microbalum]TPX31088.1 hypothetical protein SmJEL517_g05501 [Synchytrium microbalum]